LKIALRPVQGDKRPLSNRLAALERIELRGSTRRYRPTSTARPARGGLNGSLDVRTKPAEYTVRFRCCSTKLINLRRHARGRRSRPCRCRDRYSIIRVSCACPRYARL